MPVQLSKGKVSFSSLAVSIPGYARWQDAELLQNLCSSLAENEKVERVANPFTLFLADYMGLDYQTFTEVTSFPVQYLLS